MVRYRTWRTFNLIVYELERNSWDFTKVRTVSSLFFMSYEDLLSI